MKLTIVARPIPAVVANGELADEGASELRSAVCRAFPPGQRLIALDLTDLDYLDSDGLKAIMGIHRLARARGGLLGIVIRGGALKDLVGSCGLAFQPEVRFFESLDECANELKSA